MARQRSLEPPSAGSNPASPAIRRLMDISALILAAGNGKRMKSKTPKVLHEILGKPMVSYVIDAAKNAGVGDITLVICNEAEAVKEKLGDSFSYVTQAEARGTGDAVFSARNHYKGRKGWMLVICGDTPLIKPSTIKSMIALAEDKKPSCVILTAKVPDPTGYGRIVRDNVGSISEIVEEVDAKIEERMISEVNTGVYLFNHDDVWNALEKVEPHNNQKEYYLTDVIKNLYREGKTVISQACEDISEYHGINNRWDLTQIAGRLQEEILRKHALNGVTIIDPSSTYIEATVKIANDVTIYPYVYLQGDITIDEDCKIGPFLFLKGEDKGIRISKNVEVGPFVRMRPPVDIAENSKIGCFIDMKKVKMGKGSKVPHLSYVGDTEMGDEVNIGAGTITCNYDGVNKNKTKIGNRVFIGSDTMLIAPIEIGDDAYTGAGSVINRNVPEGSLGIERSSMNIIEGWAKRKKLNNSKKEKHG